MKPSMMRSAAVIAAVFSVSNYFSVVEAHSFGMAPFYDTLEIMWLQDFSISYEDDLPNLKRQLPDVFEELKWTFPHSHFGLAGFTDKPVRPFGYKVSKDYCYQLKYRLSRYTSRIQEALAQSQIHSGGDWQEAQLQALLTAALAEGTNWWPNATTPNGYHINRVIVLATDAGYHQAGDAPDLTANAGDGSFSADCTAEDYPSVAQVRAALEKQKITPIFLVTTDVLPIYSRLVRDLGGRGIVWAVEKDSRNLRDAVFNSLGMLLDSDESDTCHGHDYCCEGRYCCQNSDCDQNAEDAIIALDQVPKKLKIAVEY